MKARFKRCIEKIGIFNLFGVSLGLPWVFILLSKPHHWIGFTDGWYYQAQIKANISSSLSPLDYNQSPINYPYFAFWIIGKISYLAKITDPSTSFTILGLISAFGIYFIPKIILRKNITQIQIFALSFCIFLSVTFLDKIVLHKPHELISITISVAVTYKYVIKSIEQKEFSNKTVFLDGIMLGVSFGFMPIFSTIAYISILFFMISSKETQRQKILLYLYVPASFIACLAVGPGIISTLGAKDSPPFNSNDYWIFSMLPPYFMAILLMFTVLIMVNPKFKALESHSYNFIPSLISISCYAILCILASIGILFPFPPQRFVLTFSLLSLVAIIATFNHKIKALFKAPTLSMLSILFLSLSSFTFSSILILTGSPDDLLSTYSLSNARNSNSDLQSAARIFNKDEKRTLLVNGEYRFLQYYSENNGIRMALPFNQGWVSPNFNFVDKFTTLQQAVEKKNSSDFNNWLEENKVDTILLQGKKESVDAYPIQSIFYVVYPRSTFLEVREIQLPASYVQSLQKYGWEMENAVCECTLLTNKKNMLKNNL
jgi:hypothetical protein